MFGGMGNFSGGMSSNGAGGWDKFSSLMGGMGASANGGYVANDGTYEDELQKSQNQATQGLNNIPIVGMFKGIGDAAEGIGGMIGGKKGSNIVQGFTNPFGRQMEIFKSPDYTKGQKVAAALVPFISGFLKPNTIIQDNRDAKMNSLVEQQKEKIRENRFFRESDLEYGTDGNRFN